MATRTVRQRISAGFSIVVALSALAAAYAAWEMRPASIAMSDLAKEHLPEMALATEFERDILNARIHFIYHVTIQKPGALEAGWERFRKARSLMPKLAAHVAASQVLRDLRPPTKELESDLDRYELLLNQILDVVQKHQNSGPAFARLIADWAAMGGRLVNEAGALNSRCAEHAVNASRRFGSDLNHAVGWVWAVCGLAIAAGMMIGAVLTRAINRVLGRVAGELKRAAGQISGVSSQVASSSRALARRASDQAAALQNTSASAVQVSSTAERGASECKTATELIVRSEERFKETTAVLDRAVAAIDNISGQSESISRIIKVIDEIAFQTNILALNAAVEAARAGVAGMGFAVVADEVRNLAQRSAQAAKDTALLIQASLAASAEGKESVDQAAAAFHVIANEATRVKTLVEDVNSASHEEKQGIQRIANALGQMDQATKATAASAEQSASASAQFHAQADALREIVDELNALI